MRRTTIADIALYALAWGAMALGQTDTNVIRGAGWSFDRSGLEPGSWVNVEKQKAEGNFSGIGGWIEFDIKAPTSGWYELYQRGVPWEWPRNVFVDGELLFSQSTSTRDDLVGQGRKVLAKEGNVYLSAGPHTLRFERTAFPGVLPAVWELRPGGGDPAARLRRVAGEEGQFATVFRAGDAVSMQFIGGTTEPVSYELFAQDVDSEDLHPIGRLDFDATDQPLLRRADVRFPEQGVYRLVAKVGDRLLRPADVKSGTLIAVDTEPPPAGTSLVSRTVVDIDCVNQTMNGEPVVTGTTYFENRCRTDVVKRQAGTYRELTPVPGDPTDSSMVRNDKPVDPQKVARMWDHWGCEAFAYRFDLPDCNAVYRLRVEYPDDDRRTMGYFVQDFAESKGGKVQTGGVDTGDHYPLTYAMQTHEAFFFPREREGLVIAVMNLYPGWKAAAARIRIDRIDAALPAAPVSALREAEPGASTRLMGFYFEEPGRWHTYFGGGDGELLGQHLFTLERWGQWNRYLGANLMFPTVMCYNGTMFPSRVLDGWSGTMSPVYTPRLVALVAEKYGCKFVPEIHVSGNVGFEKRVMGLTYDGAKKTLVEFDKGAREQVIVDLDGNTKISWRPFAYNALHPRVQQVYIDLVGELADHLADCPAFTGLSSRLMLGWQWAGFNALPGLKYGYGDWTVAQFEQDTGIRVPGADDDPNRFRTRFAFLTGPQRDAWTAWRCRRIFDYHSRIRNRIRRAKPGTSLYLTYFGPDPREALSSDMLDQMREIGMDPSDYDQADGMVILQGGMYGRRYSTPLNDAETLEPGLYDETAKCVGRWGERGFSLYTSYFEFGHAGEWSKLGGKGTFINDCCIPSGANERELYAVGLADTDGSTIINGGAGWMFGTPSVMQPFLREYRSVPAVRFAPLGEEPGDPVAIWQARVPTAGVPQTTDLYFYAVNRLPVPVGVSIDVHGPSPHVYRAATGTETGLDDHRVSFELAPFMMRAFRATGSDVTLGACETRTPEAYGQDLTPAMTFAAALREALVSRHTIPELTQQDTDEAVRLLDRATQAFEKGAYWTTRGSLERSALVRLYLLEGTFPPGLWERSTPHGSIQSSDAPAMAIGPERSIIGDVRGRLSRCSALTRDAQGTLWAASAERVLALDAEGHYLRGLQLFHPFRFDGDDARQYTVPLPIPLAVVGLCALPKGSFFAKSWDTPPIRFDPVTGRGRRISRPDAFHVPGHHGVMLTSDPAGNLYVSGTGQGADGVYKFRTDGSIAADFAGDPPHRLVDQPMAAGACDAAGRLYLAPAHGSVQAFDPAGEPLSLDTPDTLHAVALTVTPDGKRLFVAEKYRVLTFATGTGDAASGVWTQVMPTAVSALALTVDGRLAVGFDGEDRDGVVVRFYDVRSDGLVPSLDAVRGLTEVETESLQGFTQLKVHKGRLYYGANGKLMQLTPGDPDRVDVAYDPQWPAPKGTFDSFAFAPNGDLYLAAHWYGKARGINLYRCRTHGAGWATPEALNNGQPLADAWYMVPTDLEADSQGRLLVRLFDEEDNPHGRRVSVFRWSPDTGKADRLLAVGDATANYGDYGLHQAADGSIFVAGGTTRSVWRLDPHGQVVWTRRYDVHYVPGTFDVRQPLGVTLDAHGRLWLADTARNEIVCLDASDGRLLATYGHYGGIDDRGGLALNRPVGVAALRGAAGREWLYIADVGNQRLVKWPLP